MGELSANFNILPFEEWLANHQALSRSECSVKQGKLRMPWLIETVECLRATNSRKTADLGSFVGDVAMSPQHSLMSSHVVLEETVAQLDETLETIFGRLSTDFCTHC